MQTLNWLDYAIVIIIAISSLISLIRGFIREALSLAMWLIAFWVALTYSSSFEIYVQPYIQAETIRFAVTFAIVFLATLMLGAFINYFITRLIDKTGLSGTDRLLGIFFGFGRGVLLVAIILLAARMTALPNDPMWQQSRLIPSFTPVENWLASYIPKNIQDKIPSGNLINQAEASVTAKVSFIQKATNDSQMLSAELAPTNVTPQQGNS